MGAAPDRFQFTTARDVSVPQYVNADLQRSIDGIVKSLNAGDLKNAAAKFTDIPPDKRELVTQNVDTLLPAGKSLQYEDGLSNPPSHITFSQFDNAGRSDQTIAVPLTKAEQKTIEEKQQQFKDAWFDMWAKQNGIKPENKDQARATFEKYLESSIKQDALSLTKSDGNSADDNFKKHLHSARQAGGNAGVEMYADKVSDYLRDHPPACGPASVQIQMQSRGSDEQIEEAQANGQKAIAGSYMVRTTGAQGEKEHRLETFSSEIKLNQDLSACHRSSALFP